MTPWPVRWHEVRPGDIVLDERGIECRAYPDWSYGWVRLVLANCACDGCTATGLGTCMYLPRDIKVDPHTWVAKMVPDEADAIVNLIKVFNTPRPKPPIF